MKSNKEILEIGKNTIIQEYKAVKRLVKFMDNDFSRVVKLIYHSEGRAILTGIGKSAIIAQKITSTLNSTGTPSIFMHAADAIHGDLGIIRENDVVLCLSKSGNTPEIKVLIPLIKQSGNKVVAITSDRDSYLGRNSDFILHAHVEKEACPNNLAPTSSTTAQLVMGDALAVSLLEYRNFTTKDFAKYHPGGALGKRLYLRVDDLYVNNETPKSKPDDLMKDVIPEISSKRLGATVVVNSDNKILGIITDGDLRRMLQAGLNPLEVRASDVLSTNPKTVKTGTTAVDALVLMKNNDITQLIVTEKGKYKGIVHLHDILREGIV
ncbi:MAG: KpsF/GutQ family sugar-phosphate isomerase [Bacteroidota bacterium]|nr:KpsF/GutQ family sugar-phosphate isomerase [Bacteroidota bacterium]